METDDPDAGIIAELKYAKDLKETMGIYKGILSVRGNLIVSVFSDTARK